MAFRKLQFKNVNATRSTSIIGTGEVAVDSTTNSLYIGDDSTVGGNPLSTYTPFTNVTAEYDVSIGERIFTNGTFDINIPAPSECEIGDWFEVVHNGNSGSVAVQTPTPVTINGSERKIFIFTGDDPSYWLNV